VTDRVGTPLGGVLIEMLDGSNPGRTALSDDAGNFTFDGTAADLASQIVRIRASRSGFEPRLGHVSWRTAGNLARDVIWMDIGPAVVLSAGAYSLTTQFDIKDAIGVVPEAPCDGFPPELSSRTFPVTVQADASARDDNFRSVLGVTALRGFGLTIVGRFVEFEFDFPIQDEVPGVGYLEITGLAPTMEPAGRRGSSLVIPFHGSFGFCRLRAGSGDAACHRCSSEHARMTVSPR
jgi:hypothetical protein